MSRALVRSVLLAVTGLGATLVVGLPVAHAEPSCAVTKHDDKFVDHVVASMSGKACNEAAEIARACALGASGDSVIAGAAVKICKSDFATHQADGELFTTLAKRCASKYAKQQGSLYVSAAAFCQLDVATLLSDLDIPVE